MSTSWNIDCDDHPYATSPMYESWSGSGDWAGRKLAEIFAECERLHALVEVSEGLPGFYIDIDHNGRDVPTVLINWMFEHRDDHVVVVNEYGLRRDIRSFELVRPKHCKTCTCAPGDARH